MLENDTQNICCSFCLMATYRHFMQTLELEFFFFAFLIFNTHVKDFKTCDIQDTDEVLPLLLSVKGFVDSLDEPLEHPIVHSLTHSTNGVKYLNRYSIHY